MFQAVVSLLALNNNTNNMKYPQAQFELLVKALKVLSNYFDLTAINPSALHFTIYQQASSGQTHNKLVINSSGQIIRFSKIQPNESYNYLIDFLNDDNFLIYPDGCADNHIETAVRKALKLV